jgi:YggT family protein
VSLICTAIQVYFYVFLVRVIFSWVEAFGARIPDALRPVSQFVHTVTEPVLAPFRRLIPPAGMFDVSFIVAIIVLQVAARIICSEV